MKPDHGFFLPPTPLFLFSYLPALEFFGTEMHGLHVILIFFCFFDPTNK